ncbi:fumarylacetoacetate hydrolase family protein [Hyaloscypha variabilis F]|uniref:Fumarylacetoacetate hydrolase family protein n=1 Tax=Hyaloscypha variabilis (strain UAMH 11265 / GT02V1 / F) TaxID=1149755 RepID=A0A2J6S850_HYAVF|nr:fumarylacetoacetate hydrolase family protein [Hyaloscypha variabilis F]
MSKFSRLIRFEAQGGDIYFADLGIETTAVPAKGTQMKGYVSIDELSSSKDGVEVTLERLLAPVPWDGVPIYCVGLNYKSHATEAKLTIPAAPPLWTKPAAALANPDEDIPMNKFCATTLPDYEAELVFITSRNCKDISPSEASDYILGYTAGNDLSCRLHQLPSQAGGQFFFAKAFDKFAPIGPVLVSPSVFASITNPKLIARVNGKVRQEVTLGAGGDMIFMPAEILSRMSQGTTIPAGTAVMTGTPAGVGAFMIPKTFLNNGDEIEVEVTGVGVLKNKIVFS